MSTHQNPLHLLQPPLPLNQLPPIDPQTLHRLLLPLSQFAKAPTWREATLSGRVYDSNTNKGIKNAQVSLYSRHDSIKVSVNKEVIYTFPHLPLEQVRISAWSAEFPQGLTSNHTISITDEIAIQEPDFPIDFEIRVDGIVQTTDGNPIKNVSIRRIYSSLFDKDLRITIYTLEAGSRQNITLQFSEAKGELIEGYLRYDGKPLSSKEISISADQNQKSVLTDQNGYYKASSLKFGPAEVTEQISLKDYEISYIYKRHRFEIAKDDHVQKDFDIPAFNTHLTEKVKRDESTLNNLRIFVNAGSRNEAIINADVKLDAQGNFSIKHLSPE